MVEIIIEKAPVEYQRYLTIGDARGNYNKKIDGREEAISSAEEFCNANPAKCQEFLEYLEKSGYAQLEISVVHKTPPKEEIEATILSLSSNDPEAQIKAAKDLAEFTSSASYISPDLKAKMIEPLFNALGVEEILVGYYAGLALINLASSSVSLKVLPREETKTIPAGANTPNIVKRVAEKPAETGWSKWDCVAQDNGSYNCTRKEQMTCPTIDPSTELKAKMVDLFTKAFAEADEKNLLRLTKTLEQLIHPYSDAALLEKCEKIKTKNQLFGGRCEEKVKKGDWKGQAGAQEIDKVIARFPAWGISSSIIPAK